MKDKSLARNAVLNVIRNVSGILFPLITFPYVSRVLEVEGLGRYNFSNSVVSYFILIAGLGINGYAIREGTRLRDDRKKISCFFSEILTLNLISTVISYLCMALCILLSTKLQSYSMLIWIFSIQILFTTLGVDWLYSIYEEFEYITIRTIVFKIISLVLIFVFVRNKADVPMYAIITVFAVAGSGILNLFHSSKYCKFSIVSISRLKKHLKPVLTLFASSIAVMIYVYSDSTILGYIKGDYEVGLYSVSGKIYAIIKSVISSVLVVSIPRLSALYNNEEYKKYDTTLQKVIDSITFLMIPCVVGLIVMSNNIIVFVGGTDYKEASLSLKLLGGALLFCFYGWIFNQGVLLPTKNEKTISVATIISALVNILLNFIMIPFWGLNAAAFTTIIAELVMFLICFNKGKTYCDTKLFSKSNIQVLISCIPVMIVCLICKKIFSNNNVCLMISIAGSAIFYISMLYILKNDQVFTVISKIKDKL